jgi:DNA-directed RNA polymerase subunit K/omega
VKGEGSQDQERLMSDTTQIPTPPKNAFELVTVAAARAKQLLNGCLPKVDGSPKLARRALQEVNGGMVGVISKRREEE